MRTLLITVITVAHWCFISCKKDDINPKKTINDEMISGKSTNSQPFTLGQQYGGGYIFYIDETGQHGLIVSLNDLLGNYQWASGSVPKPTSATSTDGYYNTKRILQVYGNVLNYSLPYAALAAKKYNGGGFNDWYLPSVEEFYLARLANNTVSLNIDFNFKVFWTSNAYDTNGLSALTWGGA
jgi:hypothetical protein